MRVHLLTFQYRIERKGLLKQLKMVPSSATSSKKSTTTTSCLICWLFTRTFERSELAALSKLLQMAAACYICLTGRFRKREIVSCWKKHLLRAFHIPGQIQSCRNIFLAMMLLKRLNALGQGISRGPFHRLQELGKLRSESSPRKCVALIQAFRQYWVHFP